MSYEKKSYFTPYKGRVVDLSRPVYVYKNLHNGLYSIKQNGLVVAHSGIVYILQANFIVNERGRQRVIKEKRKNVHAFVKGYLSHPLKDKRHINSVTYNPYKSDCFFNRCSLEKVEHATSAVLDNCGIKIT